MIRSAGSQVPQNACNCVADGVGGGLAAAVTNRLPGEQEGHQEITFGFPRTSTEWACEVPAAHQLKGGGRSLCVTTA